MPSELTSKLRQIELDATDAAAMAQSKKASSLALHVSAVVPREAAQRDTVALRADLATLSDALGAEVVGPIEFHTAALL